MKSHHRHAAHILMYVNPAVSMHCQAVCLKTCWCCFLFLQLYSVALYVEGELAAKELGIRHRGGFFESDDDYCSALVDGAFEKILVVRLLHHTPHHNTQFCTEGWQPLNLASAAILHALHVTKRVLSYPLPYQSTEAQQCCATPCYA